MSFARLLWRNLLYHWRGNLAVLLGVAVGTAVLTGALLVGDSLRGSLRERALRQLDFVDQALVTGRFFREELAAELQDAAERVAPVLLLQCSVATTTDPPRTARKVTLLGVDDRSFPEGAAWPGGPEEAPPVYFNAPLARTLDVEDGDEVVLNLRKHSAVPEETLLGRREDQAVRQSLSLKVRVLPDDAPAALFSLTPSPQAPRNALVPLAFLQARLGLEFRVNALLAGGVKGDLQAELEDRLTLGDWDLKVHRPRRVRGQTFTPDYLNVESRSLVLEPAAARAVEASGLAASPTLIYAANDVAPVRQKLAAVALALAPGLTPPARLGVAYYGPLSVPYSVVAAVDLKAPGTLEKTLREKVDRLADDEIVLVEWEGMGKVEPGEQVALTYFLPDDGGRLEERVAVFRVKAILPLTGALDDPNLVQQVRGITDQWEPPFPYDRTRKRPVDDFYWQRHRTAPKGYVTLKTGEKLWHTRFGNRTTYRIGPPPDDPAAVERMIADRLEAEKAGFVFDPVRDSVLRAGAGGFDFALLFLGFSFFLILSALLLVGLLFRLNLDRRAREVGVLLASGASQGTIRRLYLAEGLLLAVAGGLLGTAAAVVYGDLLLGRLRAWWPGGLDASVLRLHVPPLSLLLGYGAAVAVSGLTIYWATRVLGKMAPRALIQGQTSDEHVPGAPARPRLSRWVCGLGLLLGAGCLAGGLFVHNPEARAGTFFGGGMLLLTAGMAALTAWMRGSRSSAVTGHGAAAVGRLGVRNAARHPSRSLLTAGLLASAAFLLVGVESFRRRAGDDFLQPSGGSGGFALVAETDLPVFLDLNTEAARNELADKLEVVYRQSTPEPGALAARLDRAREVLAGLTVHAFRVHSGDDASCLNLYQPRRPNLLGVPHALVAAGGFSFAATAKKSDNPWELLEAGGQEVPVLGEKNSVQWMLGSDVGKTLTVLDGRGEDRTLRIDGLLHDSVFQSSLLMAERRFLELYPEEQGYRFFLIRTPPGKADEAREVLQAALSDFGFEATPSAERVEAYLAVENMYLSTFQALGGMGLLLGTLGLAVVLLRSVWERRGELALLRALGYRAGTLGWLVLAENGFLLVLGLALGTVAALVSVAPHLLAGGGRVDWMGLALLLGLALAAGLIASAIATAATARAALIPALRRE